MLETRQTIDALRAGTRPRTITIVRHGKSAHGDAYRRARLQDMRPILKAYDDLGVCEASPPPREVVDLVAGADLVVVSPLARTLASARLLIDARRHDGMIIDDLFREVDLPQPPARGSRLKLTPFAWVAILRGMWLLRLHAGDVPSPLGVWRRAVAAAERLDQLSARHGHVVLVGHSLFNFLMGHALLRRGWRGGVRFQDHWQSITFQGDA